jgi:tetratricopeptide (TPR) repeat protein
LIPTAADVAALQTIVDRTPAISEDFNAWFGGSELPWVLVQNYQLGEDQLNRLVDSDPSNAINTDLRLQLEFDAPLHLFRNLEQGETAAAGLRTAMDAQWTQRLAETFQLQRESAIFNLTLGDYLYRQLANPLLARSLREAGQLDAAAILYQSAVRAEPTLFEAHRGLARICLMQGRPAGAVATWKELLRLTPNDPQVHAALALQYLIQKSPADASFYYREALRLKPHLSLDDHSYLWANNLAWMLATHRDPRLRNGAEAVHWAKQACEVDGYQQPDLMNTLAAAYAESGEFDEAIKLSEKVIRSPGTNTNLAERVAKYLRLYRASQPLRE